MHGRYRISNDDMLYVLSTFVVEPVRWLDRFGKRVLTRAEKEACIHYYRALGAKIGIGAITGDLLLSMYLPKWLVFFGRPVVHALCDPPLRSAMGFRTASRWLEILLVAGLAVRARILRLLPSRRRPRLLTKRKKPTYPSGYRIFELGTFR